MNERLLKYLFCSLTISTLFSTGAAWYQGDWGWGLLFLVQGLISLGFALACKGED